VVALDSIDSLLDAVSNHTRGIFSTVHKITDSDTSIVVWLVFHLIKQEL
jgi:hypothetical protein